MESILDFSRLLLEKCGNRSLYNSSDRLNELLNTSSLSLLHGTLRVAICLALVYVQRLRSGHFQHPPLTAHYNFDMDRIEKLAQHIPKPLPDSKKLLPTSPVKTAKGKEKATRLTRRRTSSTVDPNDFRLLCGEPSDGSKADKKDGNLESDREEWEAWASVTLIFSTSDNKKPRSVSAASWLRRDCRTMSSTIPSASTARQKYPVRPLIRRYISSRCQWSRGWGRCRRISAANCGPNLRHHRRLVWSGGSPDAAPGEHLPHPGN